MQHRHGVAEALAEARDDLRRQRDLGHEHEHAPVLRERVLGRAQVDLGLAGAGDAVQQQLLARRGGRDRGERLRLWPRELRRLAAGARADADVVGRAAHGLGAERHEPARLEPAQRGSVGGRRRAAGARAARAGASVRRSPRLGRARRAAACSVVRVRTPRGGSMSVSARAGVEQYSAAIHGASVDEIGRQRLLEHRVAARRARARSARRAR